MCRRAQTASIPCKTPRLDSCRNAARAGTCSREPMQYFRQICLWHCSLGRCSVQCTPDQTCTEKHSRPSGKLTDRSKYHESAQLRLCKPGFEASCQNRGSVRFPVTLLQAVLQATEQATQGSGKKASQNGLLHPQYCESVYKSLRRPTRTIEVTCASFSLANTSYSSCCACAETHETSLLNQLKLVQTSITPLTSNNIAGWQCESR